MMQVGFDELHLIKFETSGCLKAQGEGCACEICANYNPMSARQIQAHLAGATPDLYDAGIAGNRSVDQACELTALCACSQPTQAGAWRIVGKRCPLVKAAHNFGSRLARQSQVRDAIGRFVAHIAAATGPIGPERACTRWAG